MSAENFVHGSPVKLWRGFTVPALIFRILLVAIVGVSTALAEAPGDDVTTPELSNWVRHARIAGAEVNSDMDTAKVEEILDALARQNVSVVEADSDFSSYLSEQQFENELTFVRSFVKQAHRRGFRVVWYIPVLEVLTPNALKTGRSMYQDHPDWVQRGIDGKPNVFYGGEARVHWVEPGTESAWMTLESPFAAYMIARIRRLAGTGVDGIWLDVPLLNDIGALWADFNPFATAQFKTDTGLNAPAAIDWSDATWRTWIVWRHREIAKFLERLARASSEVSPELVTIVENVTMDNGSATALGLDGSDLKLSKNLINVWEIDAISDSTAMRSAQLDDWVAFIGMNKFGRGASGSKPSWAFSYGHSPDDAELVMASALSVGNNPIETRIPSMTTTVDPVFRQRMYSWIKKQSARLFESQSAANVAVLFSPESRDFTDQGRASGLYATTHADDPLWWSKDGSESVYRRRYLGEYRGVMKWLMDRHIPFDVIVRPSAGELSAYPLVIAPGLSAISNEQAALLKHYVYAGGNLALTGSAVAGQDELGSSRSNSALAEIGSVEGKTEHPVPDSGKVGTYSYTPQSAGFRYLKYGEPAADQLLDQLVPESVENAVKIQAARGVHIELRRRPGELLLHLLNGAGLDGNFSIEPAYIDIDLALPAGALVNSVEAISPDKSADDVKELQWTKNENRLRFGLDLGIWVMVVVKFEDVAPAMVNDAPVAHHDRLSTDINVPLTIEVPALTRNDGDLDGDALQVTNIALLPGAPGVLQVDGERYVYRPLNGYLGEVGLRYRVEDRRGASAEGRILLDVIRPVSIYEPRWVYTRVGNHESGSFSSLASVDDATYDVESDETGEIDFTISTRILEKPEEILRITLDVVGQYSVNNIKQNIYLYNFAADRWQKVDSRIVGTGDDSLVIVTLPGEPEEFLSPDSSLNLRVQGEVADSIIVPVGPVLRPGGADARVGLLRARLGVDSGIEADPMIYDEPLVEAVRNFQKDSGLIQDGIVGPETLGALNSAHKAEARYYSWMNAVRWHVIHRS